MSENNYQGHETEMLSGLPVEYVTRDGQVFYRVRDLAFHCGIFNPIGMRDFYSVSAAPDTFFKAQSVSTKRPSVFSTMDAFLLFLKQTRRIPMEVKPGFMDELRELDRALTTKAKGEQQPEAEPEQVTVEVEPGEEVHIATPPTPEETEQVVKAIEAARAEQEAPKAAEKPKKCHCQGKEKPVNFPSITSGQVAAAQQMVEVWKAAGIDAKMIAMCLNGFFPNLSLPQGAFTDCDTEYYSAAAIAAYIGVYSKRGNPHGGAVAAIIRHELNPKPEDITKLPFNSNGHSGVCTQYSAAVLEKVENWLEAHSWPNVLELGDKTYQVAYDAAP